MCLAYLEASYPLQRCRPNLPGHLGRRRAVPVSLCHLLTQSLGVFLAGACIQRYFYPCPYFINAKHQKIRSQNLEKTKATSTTANIKILQKSKQNSTRAFPGGARGIRDRSSPRSRGGVPGGVGKRARPRKDFRAPVSPRDARETLHTRECVLPSRAPCEVLYFSKIIVTGTQVKSTK